VSDLPRGLSDLELIKQTLTVTVILILLASANSVYLFTKYRTYSMQTRSVGRFHLRASQTDSRRKNLSARHMRRLYQHQDDKAVRTSSEPCPLGLPRRNHATRKPCA
jgi:hypothetical protein